MYYELDSLTIDRAVVDNLTDYDNQGLDMNPFLSEEDIEFMHESVDMNGFSVDEAEDDEW